MAQENLTVIKGGLNRQRTKGAALKDSLYELLNGFVTTEKTVKVRPGTLLTATLTAGTTGLISHDGLFQVFASADVAGLPSDYNLNILRAPDGAALLKIHFAEPFLGSLYVAAEFVGGSIYHFWLQPSSAWVANKEYKLADAVVPTTANSFRYIPARNGAPYPAWNAQAPRQVGDKIEPTVYSGYYFEVVSIFGTNSRSGDTEPDWTGVVAGQRVNENVDGTIIPFQPTPVIPPNRRPPLPDDLDDRYGPRRGLRNENRWEV